MDVIADRSHEMCCAFRGVLPDAQASRADANVAIRPAAMQGLYGGAQPFQSGGLQWQDVGLPILLHSEPFPGTLCGHIRAEPTSRALPAVHYSRVQAEPSVGATAYIPVGSGHLRDRGGAVRHPCFSYAGALIGSRECARGMGCTCHL